jgi:hypothetical protein
VQFKVELEPASGLDAKVSFVVEARDWMEAMRVGLTEIGLESELVQRASAEVTDEGHLEVIDASSGRRFRVWSGLGDEVERAPESADLFAPPEQVVEALEGATAPEEASAKEDAEELEELLDESMLERYFEDEDEEDAEDDSSGDATEMTEDRDDEASSVRSRILEEVTCESATARMGSLSSQTTGEDPAEASSEDHPILSELIGELGGMESFGEAVNEAMDFAAMIVRRHVPSTLAAVLLLDAPQQNLVFGGIDGDFPKKLWRFRYPKGVGLPWISLEQRAPILVNHVDRDERFHRALAAKTGFKVRDMLVAPIQDGERALGVLQLLKGAGQGAAYTDLDLMLAEATAASLARFLSDQLHV